MEFTVYTTGGGYREFPGDSTYSIGEHNGVLFVFEGNTGAVIVYGASAWMSVQEWNRQDEDRPTGGRRKLVRNRVE
jgi:hypothetical protein